MGSWHLDVYYCFAVCLASRYGRGKIKSILTLEVYRQDAVSPAVVNTSSYVTIILHLL